MKKVISKIVVLSMVSLFLMRITGDEVTYKEESTGITVAAHGEGENTDISLYTSISS